MHRVSRAVVIAACFCALAVPRASARPLTDDEEPVFSQEAEAVEVKADVRKILKKNSDLHWPYNLKCVVTGDFVITEGVGDSVTRSLNGTFEGENEPFFGKSSGSYFYSEFALTAAGDTTGIGHWLARPREVMREFCRTVYWIKSQVDRIVPEEQRPKYNYLGKHGGRTGYKFTYPMMSGLEVHFYVGDSTKQLVRVERMVTGQTWKFTMYADCQTVTEREENGKALLPVTVAASVFYRSAMNDGSFREITLSNLTMTVPRNAKQKGGLWNR